MSKRNLNDNDTLSRWCDKHGIHGPAPRPKKKPKQTLEDCATASQAVAWLQERMQEAHEQAQKALFHRDDHRLQALCHGITRLASAEANLASVKEQIQKELDPAASSVVDGLVDQALQHVRAGSTGCIFERPSLAVQGTRGSRGHCAHCIYGAGS